MFVSWPRCSCGKLLRTTEAAELHANRTGHANFSESTDEIKPLSADEKEKQMVLWAAHSRPPLQPPLRGRLISLQNRKKKV